MKLLYHHPICPLSRAIRIILNEKNIEYRTINENFWERSPSLAKLNPAVEVPVFVDDHNIFCDVIAIAEYINHNYNNPSLFSDDIIQNTEIRRLNNWFSYKMHNETTKYFLNEKIIKYYNNSGAPNREILKKAKINLLNHLKYINHLLDQHNWLSGNKLYVCDIYAAAQISCLDYLGEINWDQFKNIKNWYAVMKSRPSFRQILEDKISGFTPSSTYKSLDF